MGTAFGARPQYPGSQSIRIMTTKGCRPAPSFACHQQAFRRSLFDEAHSGAKSIVAEGRSGCSAANSTASSEADIAPWHCATFDGAGAGAMERLRQGVRGDEGEGVESFTFLFGTEVWVVALVFLLACFGASEGAYRLSRGRMATGKLRKDHYVYVQAMVAALLGLLLAFTVSMAVSRFEDRKTAVVEESNAIGTAFLRAALLPEAAQSRAVEAFKDYLIVRLELARPHLYLRGLSDVAEKEVPLQRELWSLGVSAAHDDPGAVSVGLYLGAVNEMIDSAARRDAGLRNHVPESVIYMIIVVSLVVMGIIGYLSGITGGRSVVATLTLAAVVAVVLFVIMDFDRPYRGVITVSQQSMFDLQDLMEQGLPLPWKGGQ